MEWSGACGMGGMELMSECMSELLRGGVDVEM